MSEEPEPEATIESVEREIAAAKAEIQASIDKTRAEIERDKERYRVVVRKPENVAAARLEAAQETLDALYRDPKASTSSLIKAEVAVTRASQAAGAEAVANAEMRAALVLKDPDSTQEQRRMAMQKLERARAAEASANTGAERLDQMARAVTVQRADAAARAAAEAGRKAERDAAEAAEDARRWAYARKAQFVRTGGR